MRVVVIGSQPRSLLNFRGPLLEELRRQGCEVIACASGEHPVVARRLAALGIAYRPVPFARRGLSPVGDLRSLWRLMRLLGEVRPDIVLSYTTKPVIYGSLAAGLTGAGRPYALISGLGYAFGRAGLRRAVLNRVVQELYRAALRHVDAVFFQNPDDRRLFMETGLVRSRQAAILLNGSGIDLEHFAPTPPVVDPPVFSLLSRLIREKGVEDFAAAARIVKLAHPRAVFRLAGPHDPGPGAVTRERVAAWTGAGTIEYEGFVEDVRPLLAATSVCVLPSYYREGTPRSLLEAMAMGRAIVTTDMPGCRETVVHGRNGFLVPPQDPEALAAALAQFVRQPSLIASMGSESRRIAATKFDVRDVNAAILGALGVPAARRPAGTPVSTWDAHPG